MTSTPLGDYWVAYVDDGEKSASSKLYLRKLTPDVKIGGEQTLIGEYAYRQGLHRSRARAPSVAFAGNSLLVAYQLERGRDQTIVRQRITLEDPQLAKGLSLEDPPKSDRVIGEDKEITDRKGRVYYPDMACDSASCFAVWRDEPKGANAAYVDPNNGTTIWRKRFAHRGTQVSLGLDGNGGGLVAWYQDGRVHVAPLTRDGVRDASSIARVTGEQPRPSIARGANHGEWLVAWTDYEAGHLEAYVARVICK
jgi:serine/threonine-protein kinase